MYAFNTGTTHNKAYFVLVEKDSYHILNLSTRSGLEAAIETTLDFCEQNEICVDITNDYISRLVGVFYNINKNPENRRDVNCLRGINDEKKLP